MKPVMDGSKAAAAFRAALGRISELSLMEPVHNPRIYAEHWHPQAGVAVQNCVKLSEKIHRSHLWNERAEPK